VGGGGVHGIGSPENQRYLSSLHANLLKFDLPVCLCATDAYVDVDASMLSCTDLLIRVHALVYARLISDMPTCLTRGGTLE
jgi:hypothetical protein